MPFNMATYQLMTKRNLPDWRPEAHNRNEEPLDFDFPNIILDTTPSSSPPSFRARSSHPKLGPPGHLVSPEQRRRQTDFSTTNKKNKKYVDCQKVQYNFPPLIRGCVLEVTISLAKMAPNYPIDR